MYENKKKLSPLEQKAKMGVVKDLRDLAAKHMSDKLEGLKKVTVASDSEEGLKHGLDKAKEIVSSPEMEHMRSEAERGFGAHADQLAGDENKHVHDMPETADAHEPLRDEQDEEAEESPSEEEHESPEEEASEHDEHDDMDEDELDKKLQHLMAMKERKRSKKA